MSGLSLSGIRIVNFDEYPHKQIYDERIGIYDITFDQQIDSKLMMKSYCVRLLTKILSLRKRERVPFLTYQYKQLQDPFGWLATLSDLLELNCKLLMLMDYEKQTKEWFLFIEKKIIIYRKQHKIYSILEEFNLKFKPRIKASPVLTCNGKVNKLVDAFFQMYTTETQKGLPFLESTKKNLIEFIYEHFRKPDGSRFSRSTIATILTPSREDKRPNLDDRIPLDWE